MADKRGCVVRGVGFYTELEEDYEDDVEEGGLYVRDGVLEEGVFTVERVVERRKRKVSYQLILVPPVL